MKLVSLTIAKQLGDIEPTWQSWTCILDANMEFNSMRYAGPGHYIMPDIMEVGNGMTNTEDQSHISLWAMIAAPMVSIDNMPNHWIKSPVVDMFRALWESMQREI